MDHTDDVVILLDDDDDDDGDIVGTSFTMGQPPASAKRKRQASTDSDGDGDGVVEVLDEDEQPLQRSRHTAEGAFCPAGASSSSSHSNGGAAAASSSRAQPRLVCAHCGARHMPRGRSHISLSGCSHVYCLSCIPGLLGGSYSPSGDMSCPACRAQLAWQDVLTIFGCEAVAPVAMAQCEQLAASLSQTMPCPAMAKGTKKTKPCMRAHHRPKKGSRQDLIFSCAGTKAYACSASFCGACGQTVGLQSLVARSHGCAETALVRVHYLLQQLQLARGAGSSKRRRQSPAKGKGKAKAGAVAWAAGIGFGGSSQSASYAQSMRKAHQAEAEHDATMQSVFTQLITVLSPHKETGLLDPHAEPNAHGRRLSDARGSLCLLAMLHSSGLVGTLFELLRNDSMMDVTERLGLYHSVFDLLVCFSEDPLLASLLGSSQTFQSHLHGKKEAAGSTSDSRKRKAEHSASEDDDQDLSLLDLLQSLRRQTRVLVRQCQLSAAEAQQADATSLSDRLVFTIKALQAGLGRVPSCLQSSAIIVLDADDDQVVDVTAQQATEYKDALRSLLFRVVSMNADLHCHKAIIYDNARKPIKKERAKRITREMTALSSSLPLELSSSIFVRVDDSHSGVLKALIIGPEGTPYANGCFVFDICLPHNYPEVPPMVQLVTTGRGTVRFNPNLYRCGKVCLSLLGTWRGPGWDSRHSTLLQVLLSIQSLILVEEPYYNEPGFENRKAKDAAYSYNATLRYQTLKVAILGAMQSPVPEFAAVIRTHLAHKRQQIKDQFEDLVKVCKKLPRCRHGLHELTMVRPSEVTQLRSPLNSMLDGLDTTIESITLD